MLAASRLSLLYGPLVGSRENAIFKNATYNACVPSLTHSSEHTIALFVTPQKIVGHSPDGQTLVAEWKRSANEQHSFLQFHALAEELDNIDSSKCFPAFDIEDASGTRRSPFSSDLCEGVEVERLKDGTSAVSMGEGRFRICSKWADLFTKAGLRVYVFLYCSGQEQYNWVKREVDFANAHDDNRQFTLRILKEEGEGQYYVCISIAAI